MKRVTMHFCNKTKPNTKYPRINGVPLLGGLPDYLEYDWRNIIRAFFNLLV